MKYDKLKELFIKNYTEELKYVEETIKRAKTKVFTQKEKLEIYRNTIKYHNKIKEIANLLNSNNISIDDNELIAEIDVDKNYLSLLDHEILLDLPYKYIIKSYFNIDEKTNKISILRKDLYNILNEKKPISINLLLNRQLFLDVLLLIFNGYYSEESQSEHSNDNIYGLYRNIFSDNEIKIKKGDGVNYKNNHCLIIDSTSYVNYYEIKELFFKELQNEKNETINDCVESTKKIVKELDCLRRPIDCDIISNNTNKQTNNKNYELLKQQFIRLYKEEINYVNDIVKISSTTKLDESYKLKIYRNKSNYHNKIKELTQLLLSYLEDMSIDQDDIIIDFDVDDNFLSVLYNDIYYISTIKNIMDYFRINMITNKVELTKSDLEYIYNKEDPVYMYMLLGKQLFLDKPVYILEGYYDIHNRVLDNKEECEYGGYIEIKDEFTSFAKIFKNNIQVLENKSEFINKPSNIRFSEIIDIFFNELLDENNITINSCIESTKKKIEELDCLRKQNNKKKQLIKRD